MPAKILLVDDREDNLISMESILEPSGYDFVKARSGREALKFLLKDTDFALILMDVQMPNLNGFETASLIYEREKLRHIPIIFITANDFGEESLFRGYQTGAVDYIHKPINPELLRAKVSVFVELYQKNHQLIAQEQKLMAINRSLENEIKERIASEKQVKDLNHQLIQNIDRLESANRELDGFAFMASHDLQEPLRKIQTFTDMLVNKISESGNSDAGKYLRSIDAAAKRMEILIRDLLAFSRVSNDNHALSECDLNLVLKEVLNDLEAKIMEGKAKVYVEPLPTIPGNQNLLRSLFHNLIENAIKYSKKDIFPEIIVRPVHHGNNGSGNSKSKSNKYCRILVEDNGIGFEQKYAEHIFNLFRRLHNVTEFDGTGIGLAICKKIVEKHNGFISAQSEVNKGSRFTISLPIRNHWPAVTHSTLS